MRLPKDLVETAMNIVINEAQEGDLHNHLRTKISAEYGIDPDHKNWSQIKPHADIEKYANAVYDQFSDHIDSKHIGDSDRGSYDREAYHDESLAGEAHELFVDNVHGIHAAYHKR